jgi:carboxylate-amine ligase
MNSLDLDRATERFAEVVDFTVGVEEEFAILHPETLDLVPRFEQLRAAGEGDAVLSEGITGELISSEIEIVSGTGVDLHDALTRQRERRWRLFALAAAQGVALGATGTHPWADYREQPIIDTEHYRRVEEGLKYVAWRNNTFSLHVHVGVRDIDRAVKVCDRLRGVLPLLLAISANSPYLDGRDTGLQSARTQSFTKSFPRCGVPDALGGVSGVHRTAREDSLDRRVHAGVVVCEATFPLRYRRGADLRRAGHSAGVRRARGADGRLHRPGGARCR